MDQDIAPPLPRSAGKALLAGGVAALLASACCLGPLVLVLLGVSGAWISRLVALGPYQPLFMAASVVALTFAARQIWRPATSCTTGQFCALPRVSRVYKIVFGLVVLLLVAALGFPPIAPLFY
jgi:mercuric ion transport protein